MQPREDGPDDLGYDAPPTVQDGRGCLLILIGTAIFWVLVWHLLF